MPAKKAVKRRREEIVEDLDLNIDDVHFEDEEEKLVYNKKSAAKRGSESYKGVVPRDGHRRDDEDENEVEEEELAMAANKAQRKDMQDDDFDVQGLGLSNKPKAAAAASASKGNKSKMIQAAIQAVERDFNSISAEDRLAMLKRESPELVVMLEEVKKYLTDVRSLSEPLQSLFQRKDLSADDKNIMSFMETKAQLLLSYCMHVVFYLLLKIEGKQVSGHPVVERLVEYRVYLEKLWPLEEKLQYSMNKLLAGASRAAANVKDLRPVRSEDSGLFKPVRTAVSDEASTRRQERRQAMEAEARRKEEEATMTRFRQKDPMSKSKSTAGSNSGLNKAVDDGYHEDEDQYFRRLVGEDDEEEAGLSLLDRLKLRQQAPAKPKAAATPSHDDDDDDELGEDDDEEFEDEEGDFDDDNEEDEEEDGDYGDLLAEEMDRDEAQERIRNLPKSTYQPKEVARREVTKGMESHRGLTKTRPKDRKTPRTAQRYKYKRGMQQAKTQSRSVQPEPEKGFVGVRSIKPHVTHSTKFQ